MRNVKDSVGENENQKEASEQSERNFQRNHSRKNRFVVQRTEALLVFLFIASAEGIRDSLRALQQQTLPRQTLKDPGTR